MGEPALRDETGPQREEALLEAVLRHQVGIDPDRLGPVLDLAAVGIVNSGWRNSPVEDWHAGHGRLGDGDMLRVNAHTTWRVREIMRRWRSEAGLTARSPMVAALDRLDTDDVDWLAVRIFRWLVNPSRRPPTGVTLAELAGDDLDEFTEHVDHTLGSFAATAERRGARFALHRTATHRGLACPHWWGTPTWPELVRTFVRALDDPAHSHCDRAVVGRTRPPRKPAQIADHARLQRVLLGGSSMRASGTCERRCPHSPTISSFPRNRVPQPRSGRRSSSTLRYEVLIPVATLLDWARRRGTVHCQGRCLTLRR